MIPAPAAGGAAVRAPRAPRAPSFAVLVLLSGISPLATDMYLPALPALGRSLGTSPSTAQLTLTAFLVGLAVGQVVLGPLSDAAGRRPFLVWGPAAFLVASVVCALAPSAGVLVGARLVQGFAGAAGVVCARAVISDRHRGAEAAGRFGLLSSVTFLAPVVAPGLGAALLLVGDWRLVFAVLAAVGAVQLLGALLRVPETLPPERRQAGSPRAALARMADLLRDRRFRAHVVVVSLATTGFFSYIGGSSFVLQGVYGITASTYGLLFAVNAVVMAVTSALFARLVRRWPVAALRRAGLLLASGGAVALAAAALVAGAQPPPLGLAAALLACVAGGMGLVLPASTALCQEAGARAAGTASALSGGLAFGCGALVIPVTGALGSTSLLPMAALMTAFLVLALLASRAARAG